LRYQFAANIPASMEVDRIKYAVDASLDCSDTWTAVTSTSTQNKISCTDVSMTMKQDSKVRVNAEIDTFELIPAGEAGSLDIKGTVLADAGNSLHELSEYAVNGDIQWRDNEDNFKINPVLLDVTKVANTAGRSRRAGSTPKVFGLASQMTVPHGTDGLMDLMNKMKMSLSIEMETLDDMDLKMSFGDLKAISFFDSGPWFNQAPTPKDNTPVVGTEISGAATQVGSIIAVCIAVGAATMLN